MILPVGLHIILILLTQCQRTRSASEEQKKLVEQLRPSLDILCRGVDICGNATEPARNDILDDIYVSCCKACSCAEDCKRGTCCFGNTNDTEENRSEGKCQLPAAFDGEFLHKTQSYYIIETAPESGCVIEDSTCNVARPYRWGNIWPAISKETRLIYKTPFCAECHGLSRDDFDQWEVEFVCDRELADTAHYFEFFEMLIRNDSIPEDCTLVFANSGEQYVGNEKCYENLVQDCKDDFPVPDELNMTKTEIVDACINGPRIPASIGKSLITFFNPYCYICYGGFPQHLICDADDTIVKNTAFGKFTALISADQLDLLSKTEIKEPQACRLAGLKEQGAQECRKVLCPLGQFRDRNGQCVHITDRWLSVDYVVMLDLHMDQNLPSTPLVYEAILEEMIRSLDYPPTWKINAYFHVYPCGVSDPQYDEFSVSFVVDNAVQLQNLLRVLGNRLDRKHFVVFDELEISFYLSINKFYQFQSTTAGNNELTPVVPSFDTLNVTKICYDMLKYRNVLDLNEFLITKMFFCDQIRLQPREYRLIQSQYHRVLEYNGRVLYLGEFLVESDFNGETLVKVCLQDTDFRRDQEVVPASSALRYGGMAMFVMLKFLTITFV